MELFTIPCTTCKARLKVQDESAIGQIFACPKCHSMVQIVPPLNWKRGESATAAAIVPPLVTKPASVTLPTTPAVAIAAAPPPLPARATIPSPPIETPVAVAAPTPATVSGPLVGHIAARLKQDWWLFGGGVAAGVLIGTSIWLFAGSRGSNAEPPVTASLADDAAVETAESVPQENVPATTAVEALKPVVEEPTPVVAEQAVEESAAAVIEPVVEQPAPEAAKPQVVEEIAETTETVITETNEPSPVTEPDPQPPTDKLATQQATGIDPIELESKLSERLPRADFNKVPLRQFLGFLTEFTGLKFTIDAESLGKRTFTVTVKASDATVGELLNAGLSKQGLVYEPREGAIVVFVKPPAR